MNDSGNIPFSPVVLVPYNQSLFSLLITVTISPTLIVNSSGFSARNSNKPFAL